MSDKIFFEAMVECEQLVGGPSDSLRDGKLHAKANRASEILTKDPKKACLIFPLHQTEQTLDFICAFTLDQLRQQSAMGRIADYLQRAGIQGNIQSLLEISDEDCESALDAITDGDNHKAIRRIQALFLGELRPLRERRFWRENVNYHFLDSTMSTSDIGQAMLTIPGSGSWTQELDRIVTMQKSNPICNGHPVHYLCHVPDFTTNQSILHLLLGSLHNAERIKSKKCIYLSDIFGADDIAKEIEYYCKLATGGTLIFTSPHKLLGCCSSREVDFCLEDWKQDFSKALKSLLWSYRNDVLFIFCMPTQYESFCKKLISELSPILTFVELKEEPVTQSQIIAAVSGIGKKYGKSVSDFESSMLLERLNNNINIPTQSIALIIHGWYERHRLKEQWNVYSEQGIDTPEQWLETQLCQHSNQEARQADPMQELTSLIGLDRVKSTVSTILDHFVVKKRRQELGMDWKNPSMHMVFTGNPGTAKTTVARLIGRIFAQHGLLSSGDFHEVGRADLIGKYVGWTANIVRDKVRRAKGGVLFIDEAYALSDGEDNPSSFGSEAISTLVQEMENLREDVMIILAGYPTDMDKMLDINPGLRSRIAFYIDFPNYSPNELMDIFKLHCQNLKLSCTAKAISSAHAWFIKASISPEFGNGREVRKLLEQAQMCQSSRLQNKGQYRREDLELLTKEDIVAATGLMGHMQGDIGKSRHKIGFAS